MDRYAGPEWDCSSEYPSLNSPEFRADFAKAEQITAQMEERVELIKPEIDRILSVHDGKSRGVPADTPGEGALISQLQSLSELEEEAATLIGNLFTYVQCELSIDGKNVAAQKANSLLAQTRARLGAAVKLSAQFLSLCSDEWLKCYLRHPHTEPQTFSWERARRLKQALLSEQEETLIAKLSVHGLDAWSELYNNVSSTMPCHVEVAPGKTTVMGLAQASGLLRDAGESTRRAAWHAIKGAWQRNEEPAAAIVNGLAGWRLELCKRRSHTVPQDFLTLPLHNAGIDGKTLHAMMTALHEEVEVPRRGLRAIASGLGKSRIDTWDLQAPPPSQAAESASGRRTFREGLRLVRESFASVDPSLGEFVDMMEKNRWIEGRSLTNKRQGAYCTRFAKSRTPRVFQTYIGSISDIRTLAHELGHAYHGWKMRDLPIVQHRYPMTLAESASVFAETAFADYLTSRGDEDSRFEIAWQNATSAAGFLLNIPARFDFECSFYERRKTSYVPPQELGDLTEAAWTKWFGNTLAGTERQFWMTKLHFSLAKISFYNFPYIFGYLFSLGLYSLKKQRGAEFLPSYVALLRDTGRMTAEDLAKRHLGVDITEAAFWKKSLQIVADQVQTFTDMVDRRSKPHSAAPR